MNQPTPPPVHDGTLLRARDGEDTAWAELYDAYAGRVLGFLRLQGVPEPEDVLGEIWLQVVRDLPAFGGTVLDFEGWLFRVARNRAIDRRRYHQRRPQVTTDDTHTLDRSTIDLTSAQALADLGEESVAALLEHLTPGQREALGLRVFAGMSLSEISALMGRSPNTVKSLQRRAIMQLRALLRTEETIDIPEYRPQSLLRP